MLNSVDCFIPFADPSQTRRVVDELTAHSCVCQVVVLTQDPASLQHALGADMMVVEGWSSIATMKAIAARTKGRHVLLYLNRDPIHWGQFGLERLVQAAGDVPAALVYSDRLEIVDGKARLVPVIDHQYGSLRDDFDFGPVVLIDAAAFQRAVAGAHSDHRFAGWYDVRLRLCEADAPLRLNEALYAVHPQSTRATGERQFDYVDPKNRAVQIEMELACTEHLKAIGGYLAPDFQPVDLGAPGFACEASVIIPVRNRIRTISDAIRSALAQRVDFPFNVIVVDNHSTDGTTQAIAAFDDPRLVHIVPERTDLGIGGCWNVGVHDPRCGRFAVQLDSDDVYADATALATVVRAFHEQRCAMVVGSYALTDIELNRKPGGVIDHREWTPENGRNNALRINGLGAPRAFYTPLLRELKLPNTSYGEDYAVALRFSRRFQIGRVYDVVYLCRRWEGNSDASPDAATANSHNLYKDRIRTIELHARIALNRQRGA